jgi:hypothetical protein
MNHKSRVNLETLYPEIAAAITKDDVVSNLPPFSGGIEFLIDPSIESEGLCADLPPQCEITKAVLELLDLSKLGIAPKPLAHPMIPSEADRPKLR